uniref:Zinc knuckle CX2CX4HX4C domain-containing protein n=1 Tax=Chenopodium quinoa TaxID=63459 RepID=A0A803MS33_CHEQI
MGGGASKWIDIKYERLADFFFYCGFLDHTDKMCTKKEEDHEKCNEVVYQYEPWMRASPLKISQFTLGNSEKEKKLLSRLGSCKGSRTLSYNDPEAIKLGSVWAARKLHFTSPTSPSGKSSPREREV